MKLILRLPVPRFIPCLAVFVFAVSCSKPDSTASKPETPVRPAAADPLLDKVKTARANLAKFYLSTFAGMIRGGLYDREAPIVRLDHYAHRLWVPEPDATLDEALKGLASAVEFREAQFTDASGTTTTQRVAYFSDKNQLHRDQYAVNLSEMNFARIGDVSLDALVSGARLAYGTHFLTDRIDQPWSCIIIATHTQPGETWPAASGKRLSADDVIRDTIQAPFFPADRYKYACYDYHTVYAVAAAVGAGYAQYKDDARRLLAAAIAQSERVCAESRKAGDSMEEIVGRLKLQGHLVEAFFRGLGPAFSMEEFRPEISHAVDGLLADSEKLRDVTIYQGPPDIFTVVPHAIHGLDLGMAGLKGSHPN